VTSTRAVYVISVAAELAGVHPQTLRIYERRGLLDPARTGGGSRRYSEHDIAQLRRIQVERLRAELEVTRAEAREAVARTHRQYRRDLVPVRNSPDRWMPPR
jgi:MerR family transcriptional regulator/heat shock protein HspR